ncbi:hypothetical protein N7E81_11525 [Reichenbachiella carrageenanivorans]|uniref:Anti-sigma factor n=1 Tax=Reichenbachiella carrageenanivorans TaxID=2979869 RepID=A0ABY6D2C2_9BACT|nr:hypothetical protein [Reichenbachiella carrageenanivorans]UXX77990.1 hypothetical protein N7E81_11525 [Reichenbachiella carrageenanivorans]
MKDKLETFIQSHRAEFDDLEPRPTTWHKIQQELAPVQAKKEYAWLWKAAAIVFLCISVGLAIERTMQTATNTMPVAQQTTKNPSAELREVEGYYTQLISQKRAEIKSVIAQKGLADVDLLEDMEQLDQMYAKLKKDLKKNQNDERVINAMIQNLQLRVEILSKQLRVLERISKHEKDGKISV